VWCPPLWIDLDPANNMSVGASHVILAIGRDYGDIMPLRGLIQGGGEHTLKVAMSVVPLSGLSTGRRSRRRDSIRENMLGDAV
jgi:transglutaminase-like putative cysteine protease